MTDRPRIGIDGYNLAMPHGTGVAQYGRTLARTLSDGGYGVEGLFGIDPGRDPALRETLFFDQLGRPPAELPLAERRARVWRRALAAINPLAAARAEDVPLTGRVETRALDERLPPFDRIVTAPLLFDIAHRHFRHYGRFLPVRMTRPPAIMHWTYPVPVELVGARNVYTLHDLVPLKLPFTTLDAKQAYRRLVGQCLARAAALSTVSEASRVDLTTEFGCPPERINNCYQASPPPPGWSAGSREADGAEIACLFGLVPGAYFLFLGAVEPKKNIGRLLEAYLSLGTETPLVLVGGRSWASEGELLLLPDDADGIARMRLNRRVIRLPHLPRRLLLKLVHGARAVLFPSLYEGFGLPVLEAMQLGTPVLTSNTSSLPEVAGDAALQVDPYDVRAIAAGLRALDTDPALRGRLAAAGPVQAERFSTARYLERLDRFYQAVLAAEPAQPSRTA